MKLKYSDFSNCGFPEEFIFWSVFFAAFVIIVSFGAMHLNVNEKYKKSGFYPIIFLLFNDKAFTRVGNLFRVSLLVSFISFALLLAVLLLGYELTLFDCGLVRNQEPMD